MSLHNADDVIQRTMEAYEKRSCFEGPALWRTRALVLERGGMPETVQNILRTAGYASPAEVRILDIGCGRGYKNDLIVKSVVTDSAERVHIVGCDLMQQPECIYPRDPRATFAFEIVRAERILEEFGPNAFDVVTGLAVHHHLGNIVDVASQVHAVLKPGGIHLIADNFCWNGNALTTMLSQLWIQMYQWCEGNGYYNAACSADVVDGQVAGGLEVLSTFRAPVFVEGIVAQKSIQS